MATIVYQTNKKNGSVYAYRSESYRDPVTKKPRSRRTYLGRVDPETKRIIPKGEKGKRNRSPVNAPGDSSLPDDVREMIKQQQELILSLQKEVELLHSRNGQLQKAINQIGEFVSRLQVP